MVEFKISVVVMMLLAILFSACSSPKHESKAEVILDYSDCDRVAILLTAESQDYFKPLTSEYELDSNRLKINEHKFFRAFPNSKIEVCEIYGGWCGDNHGTVKEKGGLLGFVFMTQVNRLMSLETIDLNQFLDKIQYITEPHIWEADAQNVLQSGLRIFYTKNTRDLIPVLDKRPNREASNFYRSMFLGPHPSNLEKWFEDELFYIKQLSSKQAKLFEIGYQEAVDLSGDHDH